MGSGFRLKGECEVKIQVGLGEIRISLDSGREMILGGRLLEVVLGHPVAQRVPGHFEETTRFRDIA